MKKWAKLVGCKERRADIGSSRVLSKGDPHGECAIPDHPRSTPDVWRSSPRTVDWFASSRIQERNLNGSHGDPFSFALARCPGREMTWIAADRDRIRVARSLFLSRRCHGEHFNRVVSDRVECVPLMRAFAVRLHDEEALLSCREYFFDVLHIVFVWVSPRRYRRTRLYFAYFGS